MERIKARICQRLEVLTPPYLFCFEREVSGAVKTLHCQRWLFRSNPHIAWQVPEAELETGAFPRTSSATPLLSSRDYVVTGKRIPVIG